MTEPISASKPEYLDAAELYRLTGFARNRQQIGWLAEKSIPHLVDGRRVVVSREHVRARIEGRTVVTSSGPNFAAVR